MVGGSRSGAEYCPACCLPYFFILLSVLVMFMGGQRSRLTADTPQQNLNTVALISSYHCAEGLQNVSRPHDGNTLRVRKVSPKQQKDVVMEHPFYIRINPHHLEALEKQLKVLFIDIIVLII